MITQDFRPKLLTVILITAVGLLGFIALQLTEFYLYLIVIYLIFVALACKHDQDLLSVMALVTLAYLIDFLIFYLPSQSTITTVISIFIALVVMVKLRADKLSLLAATVIALVVISHCYWIATNYPPPDLTLSINKITLAIIVRHLLIYRPDYVEHIFKFYGDYISIDKKLRDIWALYIIAESLLVIEFILRHVIHVNTLVIYNAYPFIIQTISVFSMWSILTYARKTYLNKFIQA